MKKHFRRIFLAAFVIVSALIAVNFSSLATEAEIVPGLSVEVMSDELTGSRFVFVPEVSGLYQIESGGNVDAVVTLYDAAGEELAYSDDISGDDLNFRLCYNFTAGNTYYFEFETYTHFQSESVTILLTSMSAVDKDSIEDVKLTFGSVFEGLSGEVDIFDVKGDFFRYSYKVLGVEILLKNGEIISCAPENVTGLTGLVLTVRDSQSYDCQWSLGDNEVDVSLGAYRGKAYVTVQSGNLEKITVPDRSVIENTNGRYIKNDGGNEWYRYNTAYADADIEIEIGGEKISGTAEEIFEKTGFAFEFTSNQTAENPWGVGTHRVGYSFMNKSGSYSLTVTKSPVEAIEIEKLTLIENYDGFYTDDAEPWFYYFADKPAVVKILFRDGTEVIGSGEELSKYYGYDFVFENPQSSENTLSVGSHKIKYSFMGFSGEYELEIIPTPVKSISVKDLSLFYEGEGTYYYNADGKRVFYYKSAPKEMTVYFKDGTSLCGDARGIEELTGYRVNVDDSQDSVDWGVGEFESCLEFMGVEAAYTVRISASPVKSIVADGIRLYEGIDGMLNADGSFTYDAEPQNITVLFKDGTAAVGSPEEILMQTGCSIDYPVKQKWSRGTRSVTASFMGYKFSYGVTVCENPVAAVELVATDSEKEYIAGELYNIEAATLRVSYSDSSAEDCEITCAPDRKTASVYLKKLGRSISFNAYKTIKPGDSSAEFSVLGRSASVPLKPVRNSVASATLERAEDGRNMLTLNLSDKSEIQSEVLCLLGAKSLYSLDYLGMERAVTLVTDKGSFDMLMKNEPDGIHLRFAESSEEPLDIPVPEKMSFASTAELETARLIYSYYGASPSFDGSLTRENADVLMSLADALSVAGTPKEIHSGYSVYTSSEIEKSLKDIFRLVKADVTLSSGYNAKTDTVRVYKLNSLDNVLYGCGWNIIRVTDFTLDGGCLRAVCRFDDGGELEIFFDADGRTESYTVSEPRVHRHTPVGRFGTAATYFSVGYTDSVSCKGCGKVFVPRSTVAKKTLGKTAKVTATQSTSAIKLQWQAVKDATGYEVYYKKGSSWKKCTTTTATTATYPKLASGKKYTFAVKAYITKNGITVKSPVYTTFETSTKTVAPSKITSKQNTSAIQLNWTACKGASGYRIYYKKAGKWLVGLDSTTKTTHTFYGLKPGTKVTYAVRPYIKTADGIIWSDYTTYTSATKPAVPAVKAVSKTKGTINLTFEKVNGAAVYRLYYKKGNGSYKLYQTYNAPVSCNFKSLKSGTGYTFAVRAGIKTSGGWVYGSYTPVTVKVK